MKLCPECYSDSVERTSSTVLRILACVVLLFIPFGLLFCFIPFLLPHSFHCRVCGKEGNEGELIEIDWREKENILEGYRTRKLQLEPFLGNWFSNDGNLYKTVEGKGQLLLIEVTDGNMVPLRITEYLPTTGTLKATTRVGKDLKVLTLISSDKTTKGNSPDALPSVPEAAVTGLTTFGRSLIAENELTVFRNGLTELQLWLEERGKIVEPLQVIVDENT